MLPGWTESSSYSWTLLFGTICPATMESMPLRSCKATLPSALWSALVHPSLCFSLPVLSCFTNVFLSNRSLRLDRECALLFPSWLPLWSFPLCFNFPLFSQQASRTVTTAHIAPAPSLPLSLSTLHSRFSFHHSPSPEDQQWASPFSLELCFSFFT